MLPNFVVIGAPKAGSTSLYEYLSRHPEIFMPETKELDFFVAEHNWGRGREWYESRFSDASSAQIVGEASPRYSMYPSFQGVPARIASFAPRVQLIYLVRDPIARMISHYQHLVRVNRERDAIETALRKRPVYLDASRYALQIEQYLEHFPRGQLLVIVSEELRGNKERTLKRVFRFLGVDPRSSQETSVERNVTRGRRAPRRVTSTLMRLPGWDTLATSVPEPIKRVGRRVSHAPLERPVLSEPVLRELEALLHDDVERLSQYADLDLGAWETVSRARSTGRYPAGANLSSGSGASDRVQSGDRESTVVE